MAGLPTLPPSVPVDSQDGRNFLNQLRINFVGVDTSAGPQTVDLAKVQGQAIVIKDEAGNATANPITILGTVDGVVNPTIATDYGVLRVYPSKRVWQSW